MKQKRRARATALKPVSLDYCRTLHPSRSEWSPTYLSSRLLCKDTQAILPIHDWLICYTACFNIIYTLKISQCSSLIVELNLLKASFSALEKIPDFSNSSMTSRMILIIVLIDMIILYYYAVKLTTL